MFFWKPWFVYRPQQLLVRAWRALRSTPPGTVRRVRLPWGDTVRADVTKTIGASIWTIGLYEITVSELLVRLIGPGDVVVDAGANVGYMSVLMGRCAGAGARLFSFEPHPALFPFLRENVEAAQHRGGFAEVSLHASALSNTRGEALLSMPPMFQDNEGTARLVADEVDPGVNMVRVPTETLDEVLGDAQVAVLKLDVEGHEPAVLRGAERSLREHRIRHIVYEDFDGADSESASLLRAHGYTVLRVGASFAGPVVADAGAQEVEGFYEPPSFLATCEPEWARRLGAERGWKVLRSRLPNSL